MSISSGTSFWLSRSTMWFIIRGTGLVDFLFLFRLPNNTVPRLCSEFLSVKTNLTGLLSVRPISATVNYNGTCVKMFQIAIVRTSWHRHTRTTHCSGPRFFRTWGRPRSNLASGNGSSGVFSRYRLSVRLRVK